MKYRIRDLQFDCRYYGGNEGCIFNTKEEIRKDLISYHSADCNEESLKKMTLDEILDFGEWKIEKISDKKAKKIIRKEREVCSV